MAVGRGNHRTGVIRRGGRTAWQTDPLIRERMQLHWRLWAEGRSQQEILLACNKFMAERGQEPITIHTVRNDRKRIMHPDKGLVLGDDELRGSHIETLRLVIQDAFDAFHTAPAGSLNRGSYLNTIKSTVELMAKLDGSFRGVEAKEEKSGKIEVVFINEWQSKPDQEAIEAEEYKRLETVDVQAQEAS